MVNYKEILRLASEGTSQRQIAVSVGHSRDTVWDDGKTPSCIDVLINLKESGLYEISERMYEIIDGTYAGDDSKVIALKKH